MALWNADRVPLLQQRRIADRQLLQQMVPLVLNLAFSDENRLLCTRTADLATVEGVATDYRFGMNTLHIGTDCGTRRRVRAKTLELWMTPITASAPAENGTGQQRFSPQCDEALGSRLPRVQRPESHLGRLTFDMSGSRKQAKLVEVSARWMS